MWIYLLCPSTLILSLVWSCPFLRLGLLAITRVWSHRLLAHLKLWLQSSWWCSTFECMT
jgi:hypothetical protein